MAAEKKPAPLTGTQQHALDWCRARESFLHVEFRRAEITGPTIYSLIKRGLVQFDSTTCQYRALGVNVSESTPWDASQIKQPGWQHVEAAFVEGAREARANPDADEEMFSRAADGYTKRVFEEVDPVSEAAMRTGSWMRNAGAMASPALAAWREVCEDTPACIKGGTKYLMLSDAACVKLGTALEGDAGVRAVGKGQP